MSQEQTSGSPNVNDGGVAPSEKELNKNDAVSATPPVQASPEPVIRGKRLKIENVPLPSPADDAALEDEIAAALGDINLVDAYGEEDVAKVKQGPDQSKAAEAGLKKGRVVSVNAEGAFVDLAGKSQGWLPADELAEDDKELAVGDIIDVAAVEYDRRDGLVILSRKTADQQLLIRNLEPGSLVEARVTGSNTGGLELDVKGLRAFMPASQVDIGRVEDLDSLINQRFICEVVDVERGDQNIVLSRRKVLERERLEQAGQLWEQLEPGQLRHGVVRKVVEFGAFVDLGGVDGLLHVREMSWARVKHPSEIVKEGQGLDVVVIGVDREKNRISLSLRQAGGDPWSTVEQKYQVGTRLQGQITSLQDFGAFTELEPGVEGLIPISQMTWAGRIRHPSDIVQPGMIVDVEVINLDLEKRRIGLSMKSLQQNPWDGVQQRFQVDQICTGTVARVTDFGAFVTLEEGVDGLVHISELSDRRVERAGSVVKEGQELQVKILSIDAAERRISLTAKGLGAAREAEPTEAEDSQPARKPKDRPRRGGLSF